MLHVTARAAVRVGGMPETAVSLVLPVSLSSLSIVSLGCRSQADKPVNLYLGEKVARAVSPLESVVSGRAEGPGIYS